MHEFIRQAARQVIIALAASVAVLMFAAAPLMAGDTGGPGGMRFSGMAAEPGEMVSFPVIGDVDAAQASLPLITAGIALLDGFNPCAFFVLFSLMSLMVHARSRFRMLVIGGTFVVFSGVFYFLFMAAWLNVFMLIGGLSTVTAVAGLVAVVVAAINIKDFFYFRKGVSLSIPEGAKPKLFERMRGLMHSASTWTMLAAAIPLAAAANSYELLCTAGFPLVFTRILTLHGLPANVYYLYLALYNTVYVLPLAAMVGLFTVTLGSRKLTEWQGRELKLVSGMMMLFLGGVLLVNPALLADLAASAGLLAAALGATGLMVYITKHLHPAAPVHQNHS
ncbi:MAG: hypothetical protein HZC51_07975 [Nitrospirae bacterium]|nr:hypothetical protein [Nitrospirota bacterium]